MVRILYRVSYGCFILMVRVGVPPALWYTAAAFIAAARGAQEKMVVEIAWSLHCSLESAALVVPEPLPPVAFAPAAPRARAPAALLAAAPLPAAAVVGGTVVDCGRTFLTNFGGNVARLRMADVFPVSCARSC